MKIGVICGGLSSEREVSLRTGDAIFRALLKKGYNVVKIDMDRNIA
ncbi:D-alanine--D-alanine ligase, partial [Carboxydothermus islandicus]